MEFSKTIKSQRVKLIEVRSSISGSFGNARVHEQWIFCKDGKHYILWLKKGFLSGGREWANYEEFYESGVCDAHCAHENIKIPEYVLDIFCSIFSHKRKIVSEWDIVRHNRIVRRLSR